MLAGTLSPGPTQRWLATWRLVVFALGGAVLGLALGALLLALIATRLFDFEVLTVRSGSMEPAIARGDLIVVKPTAIERVADGDVVLFAAGGDGIPTVHRVVGVNEIELRMSDAATGEVDSRVDYLLVTKGDANAEPDLQEVTADRLRGEVWFTVPGGGSFTGLPVQYLLFGVAGAALAAWALWEVRERRKSQ